MGRRKQATECDERQPSVIVTMSWSEERWEEAYARQGCGENIEVDDGLGFITIKYYDKNPVVQEKRGDCAEFEDYR